MSKCGSLATVIDQIECVGDHLFNSSAGGPYVSHTAQALGWGNYIRGLTTAAGVAAVLGAL